MPPYTPAFLSRKDERLSRKGERDSSALVSFTLAGVQDFVAAARSTRDVWNGSFLLSYLTWTAADAMLLAARTQSKADRADICLLPALENQAFERARHGEAVDVTMAAFPNSVLLRVPADCDGAKVLEAGGTAFENAWRAITKRCWQAWTADGLSSNAWVRYQWTSQVAPTLVFEAYGTSVPVPASLREMRTLEASSTLAGSTRFQKMFEAIGTARDARKLTRTLEQVGEEGFRCSLCGARAALAPYETRSYRARPGSRRGGGETVQVNHSTLADYWLDVQSKRPFEFRNGERLCAVCVCRRLAPLEYFSRTLPHTYSTATFEPRFPSTSSISVADALHRRMTALGDLVTLRADLEKFAANVSQLPEGDAPAAHVPALIDKVPRIDGTWFYPDNYTDAKLKEALTDIQRTARGAARTWLTDTLKLEAPSTYYAVLAVDGDKIGDRLNRARSRQELHDEGLRLSEFARSAREEIEQTYLGQVVYAGGDDLLAFLPAAQILGAMRRLNDIARTTLSGATISMGCVLAPHNEPLAEVLRLARSALKDVAKDSYGREAFAIYRTTDGRMMGGGNRLLVACESVLGHLQARVRGATGLSDSMMTAL